MTAFLIYQYNFYFLYKNPTFCLTKRKVIQILTLMEYIMLERQY